MSDVSVRFAESAVADLEAIKEWYTDQGVPHVGDRILGGDSNGSKGCANTPTWDGSCPSSGSRFFVNWSTRRSASSTIEAASV